MRSSNATLPATDDGNQNARSCVRRLSLPLGRRTNVRRATYGNNRVDGNEHTSHDKSRSRCVKILFAFCESRLCSSGSYGSEGAANGDDEIIGVGAELNVVEPRGLSDVTNALFFECRVEMLYVLVVCRVIYLNIRGVTLSTNDYARSRLGLY